MSREREGHFKGEMEDGISYYDVLGVRQDASKDEIKSAYRKLAMQYHPDRNPGNIQAEKKFREATEACEVLRDPQKRQDYDSKHGRITSQSEDTSGVEQSWYANLSPEVRDILRQGDEQLRKMGLKRESFSEKQQRWKQEDDEADKKHQEEVRKLREEIDNLS